MVPELHMRNSLFSGSDRTGRETDVDALAALGADAGPRLAKLGLKMGQRQRLINALGRR